MSTIFIFFFHIIFSAQVPAQYVLPKTVAHTIISCYNRISTPFTKTSVLKLIIPTIRRKIL